MKISNDKPLKNLRVIELARILAGPWAGQLLADLGADVIKVEKPGAGDDTRAWGPPFVEGEDGENLSAAYYHCCNRGKTSVSVDFETPQGQEQIRALVKDADILIENFKVGGLKKYGLDYDALNQINPRLIYCSITGFGQTGPYAQRAGYDFMIQGMSGAMSITGTPDGAPMKTGFAMADLFTAHYAVSGILAAVHKRAATGQGAWLDISLLDCQIASLANQAMNFLISGQSPHRMGNAHPNIVPYEVFAVSDGHIVIATGSDRQYAELCAVLGAPQLAQDARYTANALRVQNRAALISELTVYTLTFNKSDLLSKLEARHIPAGPINTIAEAFADPQVIARQMHLDLNAPDAKSGAIPTVRCPIVMDGDMLVAGTPSPKLQK